MACNLSTAHSLSVHTHLEELVWPVGCPDAELLQQLHHESSKALEGARQPDMWAHLDEHILVGVHVDGLCRDQRGCCRW